MKLWPFSRAERRGATIENPTIPVSHQNFLAFFGVNGASLPAVTIDSALTVPAVNAAVAFLSRTMAALPLHAYRSTKEGPKKAGGKLQVVVHEAPNPLQGGFKFRQHFWQQVFTGGRGLAWIERTPQGVEAIWPMDPTKTTVRRRGLETTYILDGKEYAAEDVIDVAYMLKPNGYEHYGPVSLASKAIQLSLCMGEYGSNFFAGGGVPPLALTGPMATNAEAIRRTQQDIKNAIDAAKSAREPIFPIPPGYSLVPVGLDPDKGQMTEARRFQIEEIARAWQLPPVFLQDLERATFSNAEQQDLHLVKHLIGQWAKAFEDEANLKLFGRGNTGRYVEHNLDGLLRGDFKSRIEGLAKAIQTSQMTPNEARKLENRPDHENPAANDLLVQGATIVLGTTANPAPPTPGNDNSTEEEAQAA